MPGDEQASTQPIDWHWLWPVLKWTLFALVLWFVGRKAWELWRDGEVGPVTLKWPWLFPAFGLYLVGWLPSIWFWRRLLFDFGCRPSWRDVAHAYFCGHLGKYVPGKASVVVIRAGMLKVSGCPVGATALTTTYEVLVFMGVGAAVAFALAPFALPVASWRSMLFALRLEILESHPLWFTLTVTMLCIAGVPPMAGLLGFVARKLVRSADVEDSNGADNDSATSYRLGSRFLLGSCLAFALSWVIQGLSLGCTLRAVGVAAPLMDSLRWTGDVALSTFVGFVAVIAPGGVGVREGLLTSLLLDHPAVSHPQAVASAWLLRAVWLAAEIIAAVGLTSRFRRSKALQNAN